MKKIVLLCIINSLCFHSFSVNPRLLFDQSYNYQPTEFDRNKQLKTNINWSMIKKESIKKNCKNSINSFSNFEPLAIITLYFINNYIAFYKQKETGLRLLSKSIATVPIQLALSMNIVAIHEMGHALMIKLFGIPIESINIGLTNGHVIINPNYNVHPKKMIFIGFAGPLTGLIYCGVLYKIITILGKNTAINMEPYKITLLNFVLSNFADLIPLKFNNRTTDGMHIINAFKELK